MRGLRSVAIIVGALALVATACSSDDSDVEEAEEPSVTATAEPTPSPSDDGDQFERVPILSATATDLVNRRDLTFSVADLSAPLPATVPDVVDLTVSEATDVLTEAGFVPYLADTVFPSGDDGRVLDSWPPAGSSFLTGANVFLELDGPTEAILIVPGDELSGVVNGVQILAVDPFENWLLRVWMDESLGVELPDEDEVATIGREMELSVAPEDVRCDSGDPLADPTTLPPGGAITFTLAEDPGDDIRFAPPERLTVTDVEVRCL